MGIVKGTLDAGNKKENRDGLRKVSKNDTLSSEDVKSMLGVDDKEIKTLCKKGQISLKKDIHTDRTFFLKDDVEMLKRLKDLNDKTVEVEARKNLNRLAQKMSENKQAAQTRRSERSLKAKGDRPLKMLARTQDSVSKPQAETSESSTDKELKMLMKNLIVSQENIVKKITNVLDEKLDGMDEIVVELIRCKTENEKIQQQINKLTKENYSLKSQNASYKPVGFGLYIKQDQSKFSL